MIAAASLVLFSCTKEELKDDSSQSQEETPVPEGFVAKTFTAAVSELTRAAFTGTRVNWEDTDRIAVYDGTNMNEFTVRSIENGLAVFEGAVTEGSDEFYAVFPYTAASGTMPAEDGTVSVIVPSEQKVGETTSDTGAIVSVAKADDVDHFQFRNIVSMVKISVPDGVTSVKFSADGVKLSGACTVKVGETAQGAQGESVTLVPDTENGMFTAGEYWISVVPASLTDGCRVEYEGNGQTASVEVPGALDLVRNTSLDITAETAEVPWVKTSISTAAELLSFAAASDTYTAEDLVVLGADIDMSGKTWTPFVLGCQFDGQGHRIYNLSATSGTVISEVASGAVLKDVVFGSSDGTAYDGTSVISLSGPSENTGLVGRNSGTLDNVTSYVPVTAEYSGEIAGNEVRIGGLVSSNYGTVRNSRAHGNITVTGTINKYVYAGGITGWFSSSGISVESSVNTGDITVNSDKLQGVGGIAGMFQGGNITGCDNSGKITVTDADKGSYCGGIVGFIQIRSESPSTISDCDNTGEFDMDNDDIRGLGGIAGVIHGYAQSGVTISGCTNSSPVFISKGHRNLSGDKGIGGILGLSTSSTNKQHRIVSCANSGAVYYKDKRGLTAIDDVTYTTAGGIAGILVEQMEVTDCINTGDVSSDMASNNNIGGIAGLMWNTTKISGCTNSGNVTLDFEVGTAESPGAGVRAGIGGIAGLMRGSSSLEGNTNNGSVSMTLRNIGNHCSAGGMAGVVEGSITLADNINNGAVSSDVAQTYKSVGGIVGHVMQSLTMTRNENYGDVTAVSSLTNDVFAGGLIGHIDSGSASVPTVANCTDCVSNSDVTSPARAGALFAILINSEYSSASFTDCRIGGTVTGLVFDAALGTGAHTITAENLSGCAKSYVGGKATYSETNLQLAE